jgi:hypothetical protein
MDDILIGKTVFHMGSAGWQDILELCKRDGQFVALDEYFVPYTDIILGQWSREDRGRFTKVTTHGAQAICGAITTAFQLNDLSHPFWQDLDSDRIDFLNEFIAYCEGGAFLVYEPAKPSAEAQPKIRSEHRREPLPMPAYLLDSEPPS